MHKRWQLTLSSPEIQAERSLPLANACSRIDEPLQSKAQLILEPYKLDFTIIQLLSSERLHRFSFDAEFVGIPDIFKACHVPDGVESENAAIALDEFDRVYLR